MLSSSYLLLFLFPLSTTLICHSKSRPRISFAHSRRARWISCIAGHAVEVSVSRAKNYAPIFCDGRGCDHLGASLNFPNNIACVKSTMGRAENRVKSMMQPDDLRRQGEANPQKKGGEKAFSGTCHSHPSRFSVPLVLLYYICMAAYRCCRLEHIDCHHSCRCTQHC